MRLINIGLVSIDTTVGALKSNTDKIITYAKDASLKNCTVVAFPEQVISGYPAEDLVQWKQFVEEQWTQLNRFAGATKELGSVFVLGITVEYNSALYNSAVVVHGGNILGIVPKSKLPSYGVFYEKRVFSSGITNQTGTIKGVPFGDLIFEFPFGILATEVCEDMWSANGPIQRRAYSGAELVVNISASPWRAGVTNTRKEIISTRAGDNIVTLAYTNQVGGNDSLVFDGGGFINQSGRMILETKRWEEGIAVQTVDLDRTSRMRHENTTWRSDQKEFLETSSKVQSILVPNGPSADTDGTIYTVPSYKAYPVTDEYFDDLIEAMIMGVSGYFEKTNIFKRIGIALSGGKDSALTLLIIHMWAVRKFANLPTEERKVAIRDFIQTFSLPTRFNTQTTKSIARELAEELGVNFKEVSVEEQVRAGEVLLGNMQTSEQKDSLVSQNLQARVRGAAMWNWSNANSGMWIQTGNMSEKAVGYTTIGGDMMGAYSLLGNLPKTVVIALIKYLYEKDTSPYYHSLVLKKLLETKASAELSENQEDEKDLMPFDVLDACYALFVGEKMKPLDVYKALRDRGAYDKEDLRGWVIKFVKLFRASIFKWVQSPQSVHLGSLDLDRERALQLPVVQSDEWIMIKELEEYKEI